MDKSKIIALSTAVVLITVGFLIFYGRNKNEKPQPAQLDLQKAANIGGANNDSQNSKLTNQKMNKQGVQIEVLKEGTGAMAKSGLSAQAGDKVSVHYVGVLENGTKFDSSVDRGTPFEFTLGAGQVIPGWDIGVEGMKIGEVRKLTIPSNLAYGSRGAGSAIPPNAILIFEVELLGIK